MGFAEVHEVWLAQHMKRRTGERKSRLERGHAHGERMFLERVWWPIFGNLDDLHPEFEVLDWRGHPYYMDFAWQRGQCKFALEVKGYGSHVQNTDRIRYRRELNREIFLQSLGYRVVNIPYDDVEEQPNLMIFLLKSLLSPYMVGEVKKGAYSRLERQVLLLTLSSNTSIRPIDLVNELEINRRTAVQCLKSLCVKGKLRAIHTGTGARVIRYELVRSLSDDSIW
jgi:hypothetical protein